ncbi:MAG: crosslink repair DNA glycosylase YcaQ family protein [Acidobacteriota bacterium]|nr:crosslink repair DNA glycosylase YcaQ family protein [Acidobacteriota bacterium]
MKPASFRGHLIFAPSEGQQVRFTAPERWFEPSAEPEPDIALAEITRRYLRAYGPANREELARWWGLRSLPQAQRRFDAIGDEVHQVDIDGERRWALAAALEDLLEAKPSRSVRLLPAFDPYVAAAPRGVAAILDATLKSHVYPPQGWLSPVVLVDGRIVGTWKHEAKTTSLRVEVKPFELAPKWLRRSVENEARRLGMLFELEPVLERKNV